MKKIHSLLSVGSSNAKLAKNNRPTFYLALNPAQNNSKNVNLCKFSTKSCRETCLVNAGRNIFGNVIASRERKTEMYINQRELFLNKLWVELLEIERTYKNPLVRLNLLSDVDWYREFLSIDKDLESLDITFYDYSKDFLKLEKYIPVNYHFTFSYSGYNWDKCEEFLKDKRCNVAVVFRKNLPTTYRGFLVLDGDENDERLSDYESCGYIIGLRYKINRKNKTDILQNPFIVDETL